MATLEEVLAALNNVLAGLTLRTAFFDPPTGVGDPTDIPVNAAIVRKQPLATPIALDWVAIGANQVLGRLAGDLQAINISALQSGSPTDAEYVVTALHAGLTAERLLTAGEAIDTTLAAGSVTISCEDASATNKGVATFAVADFTVAAGNVTLNPVVKSLSKAGSALLTGNVTLSEGAGIALTQLGQDIAIAASSPGGAPSTAGYVTWQTEASLSAEKILTAGTGITVTLGATTATIAGIDATTTVKGIASFATADFIVTAGAVTLQALVRTLGILGGGSLLTGAVKIKAGSNVSLIYDLPNNAIQVSATAGTGVQGPTTTVPGNLAKWDDFAGLFLGDTGIAEGDVIQFTDFGPHQIIRSTSGGVSFATINENTIVARQSGTIGGLSSSQVGTFLDHNHLINSGGNAHIDWTNTASSLVTTGDVQCTALKIKEGVGTDTLSIRSATIGFAQTWIMRMPTDIGLAGQAMRIATVDGGPAANMEWFTPGAGGGGADIAAPFLVWTADGTGLSNERILIGGSGVTLVNTGTQIRLDVDHNAILNYVANQHIDWTSSSVNFLTTGTLDAAGRLKVLQGTDAIYGNVAVVLKNTVGGALSAIHIDSAASAGGRVRFLNSGGGSMVVDFDNTAVNITNGTFSLSGNPPAIAVAGASPSPDLQINAPIGKLKIDAQHILLAQRTGDPVAEATSHWALYFKSTGLFYRQPSGLGGAIVGPLGVGAGLTQVEDDLGPNLGGNLNVVNTAGTTARKIVSTASFDITLQPGSSGDWVRTHGLRLPQARNLIMFEPGSGSTLFGFILQGPDPWNETSSFVGKWPSTNPAYTDSALCAHPLGGWHWVPVENRLSGFSSKLGTGGGGAGSSPLSGTNPWSYLSPVAASEDMVIRSTGAGLVGITDDAGKVIAKFRRTDSAVNYVEILNAVAGAAAKVKASSDSQANADLELSPQGAGFVRIGGVRFPTAPGTVGEVLKLVGSDLADWEAGAVAGVSSLKKSGAAALTGDIVLASSGLVTLAQDDLTKTITATVAASHAHAPTDITGISGTSGTTPGTMIVTALSGLAANHILKWTGSSWINGVLQLALDPDPTLAADLKVDGFDIRLKAGEELNFRSLSFAIPAFSIFHNANGSQLSLVSAGSDSTLQTAGTDFRLSAGGGQIKLISETRFQGVNARFDDATGILDDSGNEYLLFRKTALAVNQLAIVNAATGGTCRIQTEGDNASVPLEVRTKGTAAITFTDGGGAVNVEIAGITTPTRKLKLSAATSFGHPRISAVGTGNFNLELEGAATGAVKCITDLDVSTGQILKGGAIVAIFGNGADNFLRVNAAASGALLALKAEDGGMKFELADGYSFNWTIAATTRATLDQTIGFDVVQNVRAKSFLADGADAGVAGTVTYTNAFLAADAASSAPTFPRLPLGYTGTTKKWLKLMDGTAEGVVLWVSKA